MAFVASVLASACGSAATTPAPAATSASAATAVPAATTAPAVSSGDKFVYWGGLIFSDVANKMLVDRINQWGKEKGIAVDVVMVNQNETTQRVSAAVEAGNMPDALDMGSGLMLQLYSKGKLEALDDTFKAVGDAHGGWLKSAADGVDPKNYGGKIYGIPFGTSGNLLNRRIDLLSAKGFNDAPKTWEELGKMALAVNNPPKVYGAGFALSNVGDGNITTLMMQGWGGRVADDAGKKCTIDSPETKAFMTWVTDLYKAGAFPPGVTTWDGAGDNNAYQSGNAAFIANPGSVYLYLVKNDPELLKASAYSALPGGPKLRLAPQGPNVRVIPTGGKHTALAKDLMMYLADDKFMADYYANAIYGPVLNSEKTAPVFTSSPVHIGLLDLALNGTPPAWPDVNNAAYTEYDSNFLTPKMVQKVVVDKKSVDDAIKETQAACQAIYDKYK
jgi:multiple sugar transport system substrate-binding protein